jgi:hypothetical protein
MHSPPNYLALQTAPLLHILSQFDQQLAATATLPGRGGGLGLPTAMAIAAAASRAGSAILGVTQQLRQQQRQQQPTTSSLSLLSLLSTTGGDQSNATAMMSSPPALPPLLLLLLLPLASAKFHARPGNLDLSKGASRIIKPSIANHDIFGGGGKEGGGGDKQRQGWQQLQQPLRL